MLLFCCPRLVRYRQTFLPQGYIALAQTGLLDDVDFFYLIIRVSLRLQ